jgi:hypothetical protein
MDGIFSDASRFELHDFAQVFRGIADNYNDHFTQVFLGYHTASSRETIVRAGLTIPLFYFTLIETKEQGNHRGTESTEG